MTGSTTIKPDSNFSQESYNPHSIEGKWQKEWNLQGLYKTQEPVDKQKSFYALSMFPYPSGNLHMGHVRNYVITDVIARLQRMKGDAVLHPMGWDAFGLPAENAAIERGVRPDLWTKKNISQMRIELNKLGLSIDWDKEINTSESEYYKWSQFIFLELYQAGLAYQKSANVNWDPIDKTVLANEQVDAEGKSWRSGAIVEKKELKQWFLKITEYADNLLRDLENLDDWPEKVKTMQQNWIGKSNGTKIDFKVEDQSKEIISIFTTRPDTLFGCTYIVMSPEHPLVDKIIAKDLKDKLKIFKQNIASLTDSERTVGNKSKLGMDLGIKAINPINNSCIPVWIANYVLASYGTGSVMGVPGHDERDYEFAHIYSLPIKYVIKPLKEGLNNKQAAYTQPGIMINSNEFNDLKSTDAKTLITKRGIELNWAQKTTTYKLRDWLISRQRYWGCPIPIIYCSHCGVVPVKKSDLPVELPLEIKLSGKGKSPLLTSEWINTNCPNCKRKATRESDTMDTFICSSWYFLRYLDPKNKDKPFDKELVNKWMPVNQYVGGIEHAILHLLYSRFLTKALSKRNLISVKEPFVKLLTQGMVQGITFKNIKTNKYIKTSDITDTIKPKDPVTGEPLQKIYEKMSKSKYNGIEPSVVIDKYGADTARMFILFKAPPEKDLEWEDADVEGQYRFLQRIWKLASECNQLNNINLSMDYSYNIEELNESEVKLRRITNLAIKEVSIDLNENQQFNTAIAEIMKLSNGMNDLFKKCNNPIINESLSILLKLLSPFAPHISEELWKKLKGKDSIHKQSWPSYDELALVKDSYELVIQINGKLRGKIIVNSSASKEELENLALESDISRKWLQGKTYKRIIVIPNKLINIVC
ncbi:MULTISPECIES: leucine--tRNA ligase [Prochlorococcus]|uniref:leucine--tRNA ligase n=1 Tax=Prochlorococcus TaxID=1218 RepID=UPI0005339489|nr:MULTISPECIES: leucine--tRNA ligase [Prochlorococcus]KGG12469.1 Leucyl-tRNA synthetase [Prochlorococcus sp. MIT 0601]